jgi:hypothetical protein
VLLAIVVLLLVTATGASAVRMAGAASSAASLSERSSTSTAAASRVGPTKPPTPAIALAPLLAAEGYQLPDGASVYAAEVLVGTGGALTYKVYDAGAGGLASAFWPASSIKIIAALGALDYLKTLGFTGAASVTTVDDDQEDDWTATVDDLVQSAVVDSDNDAYDELVRIAGVDWLNGQYLTAQNGFAGTVIQRGYSGLDVKSSPAMTITEGDRTVNVPARTTSVEYGCPDNGNCSTLEEMTDSVARVVLDGELPPSERLGLAPDDIAALSEDLLLAQGFMEPGVESALGDEALVYNKPGWVTGLDCLDVGLITDPVSGRRFLLGMTVPDSDSVDCDALADMAAAVLTVMKG